MEVEKLLFDRFSSNCLSGMIQVNKDDLFYLKKWVKKHKYGGIFNSNNKIQYRVTDIQYICVDRDQQFNPIINYSICLDKIIL